MPTPCFKRACPFKISQNSCCVTMKARASGLVEMREKMRLNYPTNAKEWAVSVLSVVLIIFGLPLVIMGAQLAILGGSVYYVLAGATIITSGIFILIGKTIGA